MAELKKLKAPWLKVLLNRSVHICEWDLFVGRPVRPEFTTMDNVAYWQDLEDDSDAFELLHNVRVNGLALDYEINFMDKEEYV